MRKNVFLSLVLFGFSGFFMIADAATRATSGRAAPRAPVATTAAATSSAPKTVAARSATNVLPTTNATTASVSTRTTAPRGATATTTTATPSVGVAARAATKQKVVGYGTTVTAASDNIVIDGQCREKFFGCMDAFCMLDNVSGGRCMCSDKKTDLDIVLEEIQELDAESYRMATTGVEKIQMGADAALVQAEIDRVTAKEEEEKNKIDFSAWDNSDMFSMDVEDIFGTGTSGDPFGGKTGDALLGDVTKLCQEQTPECRSEFDMLALMYAQNIRSDCTAYENELKRQKSESASKLAVAEKALRTAALDVVQSANKWDLGQCTIEFKNCMIDTGGCGSDFKGCVGIAAAENAATKKGLRSNSAVYDIEGSATKISVYASTYDALESKKPLCMNVTESCVAVKDQVWDTFLREVGPQLKTAELLAESDLRTSCISNISDCFQKACKDTIDPNDPDGSYDLCLSRPEALESLCRVQIEPCQAAEPMIMDFVNARLASMRVDACTSQVKSCLQSADRCGEDYMGCVGLDTDTIIRMCPTDKLTGCQESYSDEDVGTNVVGEDAIYAKLETLVQGLMLNMDNAFLTQCQAAVDEKMLEICGATDNCDQLTVSEFTGLSSLKYGVCEIGENGSINYNGCRTGAEQISDAELGKNEMGDVLALSPTIYGTIHWGAIDVTYPTGAGNVSLTSFADYKAKLNNMQPSGLFTLADVTKAVHPNSISAAVATSIAEQNAHAEIVSLQTSINRAISVLESDPTIQYCMTGRQVQGMNDTFIGDGTARFPELTYESKALIANSALQVARKNYEAKYDEYSTQMSADAVSLVERMTGVADTEIARSSCLSLANKTMSAAAAENQSTAGDDAAAAAGVAVGGLATAGAVVGATTATYVGGTVTAALMTIPVAGWIAAAAVGLALGTKAIIDSANKKAQNNRNDAKFDGVMENELTATKVENEYNFKKTTTANFNMDSRSCSVCTTTTNCANTKKSYCKEWAEPVENCQTIQY